MAQIVKRALTDEEISIIVDDIKNFSALIRITPDNWRSYGDDLYVVEENGEMMGVCAAKPLGDVVKLGPMVILIKNQQKGYGGMLLEYFRDQKWNIYAGSSNPILHKKLKDLGFTPVSPLKVPRSVFWHHFTSFIKYTDLTYYKELIRKFGNGRRGKYIFFLRMLES